MKTFLTILLASLPLLTRAADTEAPKEWQVIFNGRDLSGWQSMNEAHFQATNGMIHLSRGMGWLRTEREYTNFIFEAEWRALQTNYNSGFFLRAALDGKPFPTDVWQVNLKDVSLGSLLIGPKTIVPAASPRLPVNQWCTFRMEARGHKLMLDVNGQRAWEYSDFSPDHGFLGLQAEGKAFDFRNLRIQELP